MKSIVNVYKGRGLWLKPPPGIGDYLRGCAFLVHAAREGRFAGRFEPRINLDLAPGASSLKRSALYHRADRQALVGAREYFDKQRDGDLIPAIEAFLRSDARVLYVATNESWRGVDDEPPRHVLDEVARILAFTPAFARKVADRHAPLGQGYALLHVRDSDRGDLSQAPSMDELAYRARARQFVELLIRAGATPQRVCLSNNQRLRDFLCDAYGLANPRTAVENTGFIGTLSEAELMDIALIRNAKELHGLSYYPWNSGFSVWISRLFAVPARFANARTQL